MVDSAGPSLRRRHGRRKHEDTRARTGVLACGGIDEAEARVRCRDGNLRTDLNDAADNGDHTVNMDVRANMDVAANVNANIDPGAGVGGVRDDSTEARDDAATNRPATRRRRRRDSTAPCLRKDPRSRLPLLLVSERYRTKDELPVVDTN